MPVVVTGANGLVGRAAVRGFGTRSPEVRAVVRNPAAADGLRTLGAKVAVTPLSDVETLALVMRGAHTVCHLAGGLVADDEEDYLAKNLRTTEAVVAAAEVAGIQRFLFLSFPGAAPDSPNAYLRAKGQAEEAVTDCSPDHVIVRASHVYGPGGEWLLAMVERARATPAVVLGSGSQRFAPVFVDDVAAVLAAADDRAGVEPGTRGLNGPDVISADDLTDLLAGKRRHKLHASPSLAQRMTRVQRRPLPLAALEVLAADALADPPDAAAEFGVALTPLRDGLARSLER
jgi:uncharacterized protein YbjT (DUF2867 family)